MKPPFHSIRLFLGFWSNVQIEEGSCIHLIGNTGEARPENERASEQNQRNSIGNLSEMDGFNDFLRNNDLPQSRKKKRKRIFQQRINGFNIHLEESLEALKQNMASLKTLFKSRVNPQEVMEGMNPFVIDFHKLKTGQWVDVRDNDENWV